MVMGVYRNIDRKKIQFDFVVDKPKKMRFDKEINALGGRIFFLPAYKIYNGVAFRRAWTKFFNQHPEYNVIHSHVRTTAAMVLKIAKKCGLKTISHSHSTSNGRGLKGRVKDFYQRKLTKYSDVNLACSEKAGRYLFGNSHFQVINNGVDIGEYAYDEKKRKRVRGELKLASSVFVICQIGRLNTTKNQIFSIDFLKKILDKDKNTKLLIVGDGPDKIRIRKYIKNSGLSKKVIMLGDRSDTPDILCASDVFVMPSLYEGLPLALVEAQASGLPCVISDKVEDGIINDNVTIVKLGNPEKWAEAVLNNRKRLTQKKNKIANSNFDIITTVQQLENVYAEL